MSETAANSHPISELPEIPIFNIGDGGPIALLEADPDRAADIIRLGQEQYGPKVISGLDELSRLWSSYAGNVHNTERDTCIF